MLISDWSLQEKQKQLLRHPLCLALLRRKWKLLGRYPQLSTILYTIHIHIILEVNVLIGCDARYVFYLQLLFYALFMLSITAMVMHRLHPSELLNGTSAGHCNTHHNATLDSVLTNNVDAWEYVLKAVVVVTVTFNVMVEISQLIRVWMMR